MDDEWVGIALREAGLLERISLHLPTPVGFMAVAGIPGIVVPDPEVALQVLPVLAYLASVSLFPVVIHRLSGNAWAAALGTTMLASAPLTAAFAVRVKHYTLDLLVTTVLLLLMVELLRAGSSRRVLWTGLAALIGVAFSYASVFLSVAALGTACVAMWAPGRTTAPERRRTSLIIGAVLAAIAAFFLLFVRRASRPVMVDFWTEYFPTLDVGGMWTFLSERASAFLLFSMPGWASLLVLLMPVGLVWLWRAGHREYGVALVVFYLSVLAAAIARAYPMGTGRTDIFALAVTTLLICLGASSLLDRISSTFVRQGMYAGLTLLFAASTLLSPGPQYPATDDRAAVQWVLDRIEDTDALVLSPYAVFAFEWYGDGPSTLRAADFYGHGFDVASERPLTHTTALGRWDFVAGDAVQSEMGRLAGFIEDATNRLIYLETYGVPNGRSLVLNAIAARGYQLVERTNFGRVAEAFIFEPVGPGT